MDTMIEEIRNWTNATTSSVLEIPNTTRTAAAAASTVAVAIITTCLALLLARRGGGSSSNDSGNGLWNWINTSSYWLETIGGCITLLFCYFSMTTWSLLSLTLIVWENIIEPTVSWLLGKKKLYTKTTHYYHSNGVNNFEQSLDVYKPVTTTKSSSSDGNKNSQTNNNNVIILVIGSGWAGHRYLISMASNWWNASGPRMIASQLQPDCTCVCIRHRGGFPKFPPIMRNVWLTLLSLVVGVVVVATNKEDDYQSLLSLAGSGGVIGGDWDPITYAMCALVLLLVYDSILRLAARGAATLDDMMDDVATAVQWLQDNENHLLQDPSTAPTTKIWFGGYSSGAHVAAMVLHRQGNELVARQRNTTTTTGTSDQQKESSFWIQNILLISGVLGVRPTTARKTKSPKFVTEFVNQVIFGGKEQADNLPSPLEELMKLQQSKEKSNGNSNNNYPKLPHVLIGCENEMPLGLAWLDHYFVSKEYNDTLTNQALGISSKYIALPITTNHWEVLSSNELKAVLEKELDEQQQIHSNGTAAEAQQEAPASATNGNK